MIEDVGCETHVKNVHKLSDVPAKPGHQLPRHDIGDDPQDGVLPHVFDPISSPFNSLDGVGFEIVARLLDQAGRAGERELGGDFRGQGPKGIVRVDAGAVLAQTQQLTLHHFVLVVDEALDLEDTRAGKHGIQHLATHAVELRVYLSEEGLEGAKRVVVSCVFEVLGVLSIDGLVECDIVQVKLVGPDAKSMCVCQGVRWSVASPP